MVVGSVPSLPSGDDHSQVPPRHAARTTPDPDPSELRGVGLHGLAALLDLESVHPAGEGCDPAFVSWTYKAIRRLAELALRHESEIQRILRLNGELDAPVDLPHGYDTAAPTGGWPAP